MGLVPEIHAGGMNKQGDQDAAAMCGAQPGGLTLQKGRKAVGADTVGTRNRAEGWTVASFPEMGTT